MFIASPLTCLTCMKSDDYRYAAASCIIYRNATRKFEISGWYHFRFLKALSNILWCNESACLCIQNSQANNLGFLKFQIYHRSYTTFQTGRPSDFDPIYSQVVWVIIIIYLCAAASCVPYKSEQWIDTHLFEILLIYILQLTEASQQNFSFKKGLASGQPTTEISREKSDNFADDSEQIDKKSAR